MPNTTRTSSFVHEGRHVVVISARRFDGDCEVTSIVISEMGAWRKPLERKYSTHDEALAAGQEYAMRRLASKATKTG